MTKNELVRTIAATLRDEDVRKPVHVPGKVFHISDEEGNHKDFVTRVTDKTVMYTAQDVENILDAFMATVLESLKKGDPVSIRSFGSFGLRYHKQRLAKNPLDGRMITVGGEFYPRFSPARDMKLAARSYGQMLKARGIDIEASREEVDEDGVRDDII